ncbi:MAG TPA: alpha-E domain-containing protein, partial [Candidatus Elarobacter sp.]
ARMTARVLRQIGPDDGPHVWHLILEACCASAPFARARGQSSDPAEALAFLALSANFPRSLRYCARQVDTALHRLSGAPTGAFADAAERLSGRICASLDFAGTQDLMREGSASFGERMCAEIDELGDAIAATYFPRILVG